MATVRDHYASHLARIYVWMAGGASAALSVGEADLSGLVGEPGLAVDLGAGFGMHSIPLAKAGHQVLAVDSSEVLLAELSALADGLPVEARCADLLSFPELLPVGAKPRLILCMGDTLTHLANLESVHELARRVAASLQPHGRFVATFRDYSRLPSGENRFISVRSDSERILTCFLEEQPEHVHVHDILYERQDGQWVITVSSYPKLRLAPDEAQAAFASVGLRASIRPGPRGMRLLVADA